MVWEVMSYCAALLVEGEPLRSSNLPFGKFQAKEAGEVEALIEQARNTPKGQKKAYSNIDEMPKGYHPRFVEGAT